MHEGGGGQDASKRHGRTCTELQVEVLFRNESEETEIDGGRKVYIRNGRTAYRHKYIYNVI